MPEMWSRRHALQIVAQLPDDVDEALAVLEYAKELVEGFLRPGHSVAPSMTDPPKGGASSLRTLQAQVYTVALRATRPSSVS